MNIQYKYNDVEKADELTNLVEQKFATLEKLLKNATSISALVEFERVAAKQSGQIFRFEANLTVDGQLYRAEATEDTFEKAIDEARNELDKSLRRASKRRDSLFRKGARSIKRMMRRG